MEELLRLWIEHLTLRGEQMERRLLSLWKQPSQKTKMTPFPALLVFPNGSKWACSGTQKNNSIREGEGGSPRNKQEKKSRKKQEKNKKQK